jgi:hypothetical protein
MSNKKLELACNPFSRNDPVTGDHFIIVTIKAKWTTYYTLYQRKTIRKNLIDMNSVFDHKSESAKLSASEQGRDNANLARWISTHEQENNADADAKVEQCQIKALAPTRCI